MYLDNGLLLYRRTPFVRDDRWKLDNFSNTNKAKYVFASIYLLLCFVFLIVCLFLLWKSAIQSLDPTTSRSISPVRIAGLMFFNFSQFPHSIATCFTVEVYANFMLED